MVTYSSLDPALHEIRLLRVLPERHRQESNSPSFVHCELSIHRLNEANPPSYTALSYVWGPEPTVTVPNEYNIMVLNGERIAARENLLHALRAFRKRGEERHIWVDAVCINQSDMEEKKVQIALMGQIYSLAGRTIIWLGSREGDSDLGMDFIDRVKAEDLGVDLFHQNDRCLRAVIALLQRTWCKLFLWTGKETSSNLEEIGSRVWILQEAFLSKLPIARCGDKDILFERFVVFKELHSESYKKWPTMWRKKMPFENVRFVSCLSNWGISRSELATKGGASPFSWMASMSSRLLATVPHDKIYGVLGLSTQEDRECLKADYERPLRDVIIDVVVRSLKTEGLMCLSLVLPQENRTADLNLPSWVPDLTSLDFTQNLIGCKFKANISAVDQAWETLARDSDLTAEEAKLVWSTIGGHETLLLYGCLCDVVTVVEPMPVVPQYEGFDADVAEKIKAERGKVTIETFRDWERLALHVETQEDLLDAYENSAGGRKSAFWRTLSCDSGVKGDPRPLPSDFGQRYEALLGRQPPPDGEEILIDPMQNDWVREYGVPAHAKCVNKSFFLTQQGRMGLAVRGVRKDDIVIIARGGKVPFVIRKRSDWGVTFVGEAYLHGVMDGEGVTDAVRQGWTMHKLHLR